MNVTIYYLFGKEKNESVYLKLSASNIAERIRRKIGPMELYKEEGDIVYDNSETAIEVADKLSKITGLDIIVTMDPDHFGRGLDRKKFLEAEAEAGCTVARFALDECK